MGSGLPRAREEVVWQVVTGWTSWWCLVFQYEDTPSQTEVFGEWATEKSYLHTESGQRHEPKNPACDLSLEDKVSIGLSVW